MIHELVQNWYINKLYFQLHLCWLIWMDEPTKKIIELDIRVKSIHLLSQLKLKLSSFNYRARLAWAKLTRAKLARIRLTRIWVKREHFMQHYPLSPMLLGFLHFHSLVSTNEARQIVTSRFLLVPWREGINNLNNIYYIPIAFRITIITIIRNYYLKFETFWMCFDKTNNTIYHFSLVVVMYIFSLKL
jgi:hypothetical protein